MSRPWSEPRWPWRIALLACVLIVGMYCTNQDMNQEPDAVRGDGRYHPVLARGDGHMLYLMARSTALDGDWVFDNDLARFGDPWNQPRTKTGRKSIQHPIGPALVWTPMIWTATAGAAVANVFGAGIPLHGYTLWTQRFVFLSSALFGCGAALLGRRIAKRLVGGAWAPSYAAVAVLLGTPLTYYATYMPSYAHAMDAFACAAFLAYWAETLGRRDLKRWVLLGLLLGASTLIRVQELAMGVVVALEIGIECVRAPRRALGWLAGGALVLVVAVIVFIPQLYEWHVVFGKVSELPQGAKYTRLEAPMIVELLFAPRNGWFSTTPVAYAACLGLVLAPKRHRVIGAGLIAAVFIQIYLNSTILDWWGGAAFGQRRMTNVTLPLVVGLAVLLHYCGRLRVPRWFKHAFAVGVFGGLVAWNLAKVRKYRSGKAAPAELTPANPPERFRWLYDHFGDPFEFPANAIFALRHDVPLKRWDETIGNYPLVPALDSLLSERLWEQQGGWSIGSGNDPYIAGGFGPVVRDGHPHRVTTAEWGTALVPNLMPYGQRLTLWLAADTAHHATVRWNGEVVKEVEVASWAPVSFDLPDIALHTNELSISGPGISVGDLQVQFLPR